MSRNAFSAFFALGMGLAVFVSATRYSIDDSPGLGRRFDGIGGISGGGATSRLLVNYPEPQRSEILDYLFKPDFGASLHILKVEIGGDSQTSDGTEASHMHNEWDENYSRGYEWWLMVEAKRRNPDILLYGLPWAFPGWIGAGSSNPFTNVTLTADYIVRWVKGAKSYYNLTIDFLGIWNEKSYSVDYILTLRKLLDAADLQNTKIVASDNKWDIVSDIIENSSLASAVDYIGVHYPGTVSPQAAIKTGKPLWSSEDYSTFNDITGAGCLARILNQNYVNGLMTSTLSWNLIAAYYNALPYPRTSLMTAEQPWSGHYVVNYPIWITAHTTQFTRPGWQYLRHDSGVGKLANGGSYVSFTDGSDALTIVLETLSHDNSVCIRPPLPPFSVAEQNVTFTLGGNFSSLEQLNVSFTRLAGDNNRSTVFQQMKPFPVKNGTVTFVVGVNEVYTLTTQPAGTKGTSPQPPPPKPFPLPYEDDFESYQQNGEPNNFAQQVGSFEVVKSADANRSNVLRQVVLEDPIDWCPGINLAFPLNLIGSDQWTDILVEVDVRIGDVNGTDGVFVASRVDQGGCEAFGAKGFYLFLFPKEQKYELSNDLSRTICLKTGRALVNSGWTRLGIRTENATVSGFLNDQLLFSLHTSGVPSHGFAGIGAGSFGIVDFDNFHVSGVNTTDANGANTLDRKEDVLYFIPGLLKP